MALNLDVMAFGDAANLGSPRTIRSGRPLNSLINTRSETAPKSPSHASSRRAVLPRPESPSTSEKAAPSRTKLPTYTKSRKSAQPVSGSLSRLNKRHKRSRLLPTITFARAANNKATFF
jgi:hypothetical protein